MSQRQADRPWTDEELQKLKAGCLKELSARQIANLINRRVRSVKNKARELRLIPLSRRTYNANSRTQIAPIAKASDAARESTYAHETRRHGMGPWRLLFFAGQQLTSPSQPCGRRTVCGLAETLLILRWTARIVAACKSPTRETTSCRLADVKQMFLQMRNHA
jgi:hypothetical protein